MAQQELKKWTISKAQNNLKNWKTTSATQHNLNNIW